MTQASSDPAFDYAPVGLAVLEDRIIKRCNLQFADIFGGTVAELCDLPVAALYPSAEDYHRIGEAIEDGDENEALGKCGSWSLFPSGAEDSGNIG